MNIGERAVGDAVVLSPDGRLDSNTSEAFEQAVMDKIDSGKARMVIDLSGLDYISSAVLRVLLMASKQVKTGNGTLALCGLKDHIREVFEISGFLPILTIVDDEDAALSAVGASV